jgi:hypothetical protein
MAIVVRRRRRRRAGLVSTAIRRYANAILFIVLGAFIVAVISYVTTLVPEITLEITDNLSISNRLVISFIGWIAGILFVLSGIRRFGIRI